MSAQRYPEDFDGIIAGAPAADWTGFTTAFAWNEQAMLRPNAYIPMTLTPSSRPRATSSAMRSTALPTV